MDIQDHLNVDKVKLQNDELKIVIGGKTSISGTLINAGVSAFKTIYSFGQYFGSAIRRIYKKKLCSLK